MTFAGSPDRVEAQLVPEAGFELDTFRDQRACRGSRRLRSPARCSSPARHRVACRRILRARRPDVVLGGGGYVAGPMVFAAATMRIPAALTEADAHLGLANRLAAPFARRLFLAYPIATRYGAKARVVGRPIPARSRPVPQHEAREIFELPADGPRARRVRRARRRARAERVRRRDVGASSGPPILHITGRRDFELVRGRVKRDDYRSIAETDRFGAALSAVDWCSALAARRLGGRRRRAARDLRAVSVRDRRPPGANAEHFVRAGGAIMVRELELDEVPELVRSLLDDPDAPRSRCARRCCARRGRTRRTRSPRS